eukprot:UN06271
MNFIFLFCFCKLQKNMNLMFASLKNLKKT